jgi:AraC-like DNA-binding protein
MNSVIFNTHDVVLLITVYQCLLFGLFLLTLKKGHKKSNILLSLFLLSHAAIPLDTLINFGEAFRQHAIEFSPNIFYVFGTAYWLEAVFLLFYVKSLIYKDFHFKKYHFIYFLPFLVYVVYEWFTWFSLSSELKLNNLNGYHLASEPSYEFAINLFRECFRAFCVALCLRELIKYQTQIKNEFADIEEIDLTWLKLLVGGFLIISVQSVFVTIGVISTIELNMVIDYRMLGLITNYTVLILISVLIFFSLGFSTVFQGIEKNKQSAVTKEEIDPEQISAITDYMTEHKPYLNHLLTLDNLASQLFIQPRQLSQIINRQFKQNFFEFINAYRIEESKAILQKAGNEKITMLKVMEEAGFNSKATFNTFFKKIVGLTPTQYRKEQIQLINK